MIRAERIAIFASIFLFTSASLLVAEFPRISRLSRSDLMYRQQQDAVQRYYRSSSAGKPLPGLEIYTYEPQPRDTLITLAASFSVPYSSLASLNRLPHAEIPRERREVLIPSVPGIFLPADPENDLERLMSELRSPPADKARPIMVSTQAGRQKFLFFPGDDFDRTERLSFLNVLFRRPVDNTRITSFYGYRRQPVTGLSRFHGGVDFAAPRGTNVTAAREGSVEEVGVDPIFGNYVLLSHRGGYETFYGHLKESTVELKEHVTSGMIIGKVGNSGFSTGPHLHFEIRLDGKTQDPLLHLPGLHR